MPVTSVKYSKDLINDSIQILFLIHNSAYSMIGSRHCTLYNSLSSFGFGKSQTSKYKITFLLIGEIGTTIYNVQSLKDI